MVPFLSKFAQPLPAIRLPPIPVIALRLIAVDWRVFVPRETMSMPTILSAQLKFARATHQEWTLIACSRGVDGQSGTPRYGLRNLDGPSEQVSERNFHRSRFCVRQPYELDFVSAPGKIVVTPAQDSEQQIDHLVRHIDNRLHSIPE
jgi:hypothetical protein